MKRLNKSSVLGGLLVIVAVTTVVGHWAWRAAHRGGFPVFSWKTVESIWPWLVLLALGLVAAWAQARAERSGK